MIKKVQLLNKILSVALSVAIIFFVSSIFCGCIDNNYSDELLRLHIRANSNADGDQVVKLSVRDAVNSYICENVNKTSFAEAYEDIRTKLDGISYIAASVLEQNGYYYGARAKLAKEYFPTRKYGKTTVPEGCYDALIIELGEAKGDNWWCVIYPPLCYGSSFEYKSIFAELFG